MLIRYYTETAFPLPDVERVLLEDPHPLVAALSSLARERARRLLAESGQPRLEPAGPFEVELGAPARLESKVLLPMTWFSTAGPERFSLLEADIEAAGLGSHRTQLAATGRFRIPARLLEGGADPQVVHRVAEATMKHVVDGIADAVRAALGAPTQPAGAAAPSVDAREPGVARRPLSA